MGVRINARKADNKTISINLNFTDNKEHYGLMLENSVLIYTPEKRIPFADTTIRLSRDTLNQILLKQKTIDQAIRDGSMQITGDKNKLTELLNMMDEFPPMFDIITANPANDSTKN